MKILDKIQTNREFNKFVKEIKSVVEDLEEIQGRFDKANQKFLDLEKKFIKVSDKDRKSLINAKNKMDASWYQLQKNMMELKIRLNIK